MLRAKAKLISICVILGFAQTSVADQAKVESSQAPSPVPSQVPLPVKQTGRVVTRAVGEAGDRVVTSREVRINDVVEQVIAKYEAVPSEVSVDRAAGAPEVLPAKKQAGKNSKAKTDVKKTGDQPPQTLNKKIQVVLLRGDEKSFPARVTDVLVEWIIYLEARSFSSEGTNRSDAALWVKRVEDEMDNDPVWNALEVSQQELKDLVDRKLLAKSFLRLKTDSSLVPVTDAEAQAYFKKNRIKFGSMPFSSFKENIKSFLKQQQTDRRLKDWLEVLQRRYKVRNFIAG